MTKFECILYYFNEDDIEIEINSLEELKELV